MLLPSSILPLRLDQSELGVELEIVRPPVAAFGVVNLVFSVIELHLATRTSLSSNRGQQLRSPLLYLVGRSVRVPQPT
jgi:hypothetical protein